MGDTVIKVENLGKLYRLGEIGTGTISHDLNRWWAKVKGKEDPYAKIGENNDRTIKGKSDYVWALKDINFELKRGEVLGIIGRNGAGKSTLLKILSKVTTPTEGKIKIKGRIASLLEVGTGFHPELTGRENIFLNGAILGMTKHEIHRKFDEIVDFAGVERYIDTPVKRYSSGMYVRLAFAVAAFLEPEILIVDEVLAVGDAEFQNKCLGRMKDVSKNEGRTVLFVSHNLPSVELLCKNSLLLQQGMVKLFGDTQSVISDYISLNKTNITKNLIDHISDQNVSLEVLAVTVNGSSKDNLVVNGGSRKININFSVKVNKDSRISAFAYLYDEKEYQIAICSPGHMNSNQYLKTLTPGFHSLTFSINPMNLNAGLYYLSFGLANPGIEGFATFEKALRIEATGIPTSSGLVFEQNKNGYFLLEGSFTNEEALS